MHRLTVSFALALVLALTLPLAGCSDDASPADGLRLADGPPGHDLVVKKEAVVAGDTACPEGEKRCATLYKIHQCVGGVWKDTVDCETKKSGGQSCPCSPTLMFVCALGGKECP